MNDLNYKDLFAVGLVESAQLALSAVSRKMASTMLRELAAAGRRSQDMGSRNLVLTI